MMGMIASWLLKQAQEGPVPTQAEFRSVMNGQAQAGIPEDVPAFFKAFCSAGVFLVDESGWGIETVLMMGWRRRGSNERQIRAICERYHLLRGEMVDARAVVTREEQWRHWTFAMAKILDDRWHRYRREVLRSLTMDEEVDA